MAIETDKQLLKRVERNLSDIQLCRNIASFWL